VQWGVVGLSNFKSRFIEDRAPINQKATVDVEAFVRSPTAILYVSFN
jgi:hypothetical protein